MQRRKEVFFRQPDVGQFLLVEFLHANTDVVREHEVEKYLLFALKTRADRNLALAARSSRVKSCLL